MSNHIFANTKMKIPYRFGSKSRKEFWDLLKSRKIVFYNEKSWTDTEFRKYIVINSNGELFTYYSETGYNKPEYNEFKIITEADLKANRILDIVEPYVEDYIPSVKTTKKKTTKNKKVATATIKKVKALAGGDLAIHPNGTVILLASKLASDTTKVKGTVMGSTKKETAEVGDIVQYDLATLTRFDGTINIKNGK